MLMEIRSRKFPRERMREITVKAIPHRKVGAILPEVI